MRSSPAQDEDDDDEDEDETEEDDEDDEDEDVSSDRCLFGRVIASTAKDPSKAIGRSTPATPPSLKPSMGDEKGIDDDEWAIPLRMDIQRARQAGRAPREHSGGTWLSTFHFLPSGESTAAIWAGKSGF